MFAEHAWLFLKCLSLTHLHTHLKGVPVLPHRMRQDCFGITFSLSPCQFGDLNQVIFLNAQYDISAAGGLFKFEDVVK